MCIALTGRECSTPFGITARGTTAPASYNPKARSAQRLWASRAGEPPSRKMVAVGTECSTPFGITARGTRLPRWSPPKIPVLNAFRHHGQGNVRRLQRGAGEGPVVLNAFRHHGQGNHQGLARSTAGSVCSTPFGITARGTDEPRLNLLALGQVLNAFRHHGQGNPHAHHAPEPEPHVLNAFRHHGQGNVGVLIHQAYGNMCSTPFGITARGTTMT